MSLAPLCLPRVRAALALLAVSLIPAAAVADGDRRWEDDDRRGRYSRDVYIGPAYDQGQTRGFDTDYAQVLSARPVYRDVRVSEPRQECWDERVRYDDRDWRGGRDVGAADRTIGAVVGGVIGGAIGRQFSAGSGQDIATAIGAVIGADVGRNAVRGSDRGERYEPRYGYENRCRTVRDSRWESRIDGYDVAYRYQGRTYYTRMPYDPGARLPVRVDVSPLRH